MPVSRKKTGAQKCVIHRVKNNGTVVWVGSVGLKAGLSKEVTRMIERHQNHDDAAKEVNRFEAEALGCGTLGHRCSGMAP